MDATLASIARKSHKQFIKKDVIWAVVFALLWIVVMAADFQVLSYLNPWLPLAVFLFAWLYKKPYSVNAKKFIGFARWFGMFGLLLAVTVTVFGFYNGLAQSPMIALAVLLAIGSAGLYYKVLLDWSVSLQTQDRIEIGKDRNFIIAILVLGVAASLLI